MIIFKAVWTLKFIWVLWSEWEPKLICSNNNTRTSLVVQMVKNLAAMWETWVRSPRSRSPREENGNPLKYSCLKNPMDRGAWRATVHRVTKSQTQLKQLSRHASRVLADDCHWLNLCMTVFWKQGTNQSTFCNFRTWECYIHLEEDTLHGRRDERDRKEVGNNMGLQAIGTQTRRSTFQWHTS